MQIAPPELLKEGPLFVFHLPGDIDDHGLLQLFAPYGAVRSNVMRHETGRSRGFGFVHFNTRHEAQSAIDRMNGHHIGQKRLRVSFKRDEGGEKKPSGYGAVSGSSRSVSSSRHNPLSAATAEPQRVRMLREFMAATMELFQQQQQAAVMAAAVATTMRLNIGKMQKLLAAQSGLLGGGLLGGGDEEKVLFVLHLPDNVDDDGLLKLFAPHGAVGCSVICNKENGESRGHGFVHFNTTFEAEGAIRKMNGHQIGEKRLRVMFKEQRQPERTQTVASTAGKELGVDQNPFFS